MAENRVTFGSKLGVILATVGCAVGLGSVWRFPYMLGTNGGAAFLLVYILFTIFLGLPVMITEFFVGRHSRSNTVGSFKKLAPGTRWSWIGYNGILAAFLILSYYSVVSGWTLEYVWQTLNGSLYGSGAADYTEGFEAFSSDPFRPIFWTAVFIGLTHFVIVSGVDKGIERASKVMMPLLFLILVVMCVRSVTLPDAEAGLVYLFKPDLSKLTSSVVLSALGQAFFTLSLGMGCLITYASYFSKDTNMQATAWQVTLINTFVAVLAGVMIFPAVFSFGIAPSAARSAAGPASQTRASSVSRISGATPRSKPAKKVRVPEPPRSQTPNPISTHPSGIMKGKLANPSGAFKGCEASAASSAARRSPTGGNVMRGPAEKIRSASGGTPRRAEPS